MLCAVICGTTSCPEKRPSISTSCGRIPPSSRFWHCPCHPRILSAFRITLPVPLSCSHMALPLLISLSCPHMTLLPFPYLVYGIIFPIFLFCPHMALSSPSPYLVCISHYHSHFHILFAYGIILRIPLSCPQMALSSSFPYLVRIWQDSPHSLTLSAYGIALPIP